MIDLTPALLTTDPFHSFLQRIWSSDLSSLPEVIDAFQRDPVNYGCLFATEAQSLCGVSLITLPGGALDTTPQILHFHNEGSAEARRALIQATVDFIGKKGYNSFMAINGSGRPDKAWMKLFQPQGWSLRPKYTIMEFNRE